MDLSAKAAAFCRELDDSTLSDMAGREKGMELVYRRAAESLKAGTFDRQLENDLDAVDAMVRRVEGQGLYPSPTRTVTRGLPYQVLPGPGAGTGAQWWTCPRGLCAGRGRVRPNQTPPSCAATGDDLIAGPLPG
jgi:hypothetical protein